MKNLTFLFILILKLLICLPVSTLAGSAVPGKENTNAMQEAAYVYIDGIKRPEDLIVIPDTSLILGSSMGTPGNLFTLNSKTKTIHALDIDYDEQPLDKTKKCPGQLHSTLFEPHGINLKPSAQGYEIHVVNHGKRESIEIFDLKLDTPRPTLIWKDCIIVPEGMFHNSVVSLPEGGVAITNMYNPGDKTTAGKFLKGESTGAIWEWHPASGWVKVPGSDLSGNNGLEISKDGNWYYVTGWASKTLMKLSRKIPEPLSHNISFDFLPDNIRWTEDGSILVAGHGKDIAGFFECQKDYSICKIGSSVVEIHPETIEIKSQIDIPDSSLFGLASVAVSLNNEIFVGSFMKNAIVYLAY